MKKEFKYHQARLRIFDRINDDYGHSDDLYKHATPILDVSENFADRTEAYYWLGQRKAEATNLGLLNPQKFHVIDVAEAITISYQVKDPAPPPALGYKVETVPLYQDDGVNNGQC